MDIERPSKSALIRALRDANKARPRGIGFGRDSDGEKPAATMVLVASLNGVDLAAAKAAVAAGAVAVAFQSDGAKTAGLSEKGIGEAVGRAVAGLAVAPRGDSLAVYQAAGATDLDFVILDIEDAPAQLASAEGPARLVRVGVDTTTSWLRALGELRIDAIIADAERGPNARPGLSMRDLVAYRHAVECFRQPVLATLDASVGAADLQPLRDAGIVGVVVPVDASNAAARLTPLREAIGNLKVKRDRSTEAVSIPSVGFGRAGPTREAEEDDDDD